MTQQSAIVVQYASIISNRELIRNLILKDLKLKYRDSVLGFVWPFVNPLHLILV